MLPSLKKLRHASGFTLIGVLVASAIGAIFFANFSSSFFHLLKGSRNIANQGDYADILHSVRLTLSNPALCKCNVSTIPAFSESTVATHTFSLAELKSYDKNCNAMGTLMKKATGPVGNNVWVKDLLVKDFKKIDTGHYLAKLRVEVEKPQGSLGGSSYAKEFDLALLTQTTAGSVTINDCQRTTGPSSGVVGGDFWSTDLTGTHSYAAASYTVPTGKTLVLTHIVPSPGPCVMNNSLMATIANGLSGGRTTAPLYLREGTPLVMASTGGPGACNFSGYLMDSTDQPGGDFWYATLTGTPYPSATYTVPSGKVLVLNSVVASNGSCTVNNSTVALATPFVHFTADNPMYFKEGTTLVLRSTYGPGACGFSGYLLDK